MSKESSCEIFGSAISPKRLLLILALCVLALSGATCSGQQTVSKDFDADEDPGNANVKTGVKPEPDAEVAVIETADYGRIVIELYPNVAPKMVERFKKLISDGFYNGTTFHRINPGLGIIQGGDPLSRDSDPLNDGTGGSDYPDVPAEFTDVPYERGIVGAARSQSIDSANSQFYITLKRVPAFDKRYTVFGRVIEGLNNADIISTAPIAPGSEHPADGIVIKSITLARRG